MSQVGSEIPAMSLSDVLEYCAEAVMRTDGCTRREAYGKLATACMRRGGYEVAFAPEANQ